MFFYSVGFCFVLFFYFRVLLGMFFPFIPTPFSPPLVCFQRTLVSSPLITRSILNSITSHPHKEQAGSPQHCDIPTGGHGRLGTALGCCERTWCASVHAGPYSCEAGDVQMSKSN